MKPQLIIVAGITGTRKSVIGKHMYTFIQRLT